MSSENSQRNENTPQTVERQSKFDTLQTNCAAIDTRENILINKANSRTDDMILHVSTTEETRVILAPKLYEAKRKLITRVKQITTAATFLLAINSSAFAENESDTQKTAEVPTMNAIAETGNQGAVLEITRTIIGAVAGVASEAFTKYKTNTSNSIDLAIGNAEDTSVLERIEGVRNPIQGIPLIGGKLMQKIEGKLPLVSLVHGLVQLQDIKNPASSDTVIDIDEAGEEIKIPEKVSSPAVEAIKKNFEILTGEESTTIQKLDAGNNLSKSPLAEKVLKKIKVFRILHLFSDLKALHADIENPKISKETLIKKIVTLLLDAKTFGLASVAIGMLTGQEKVIPEEEIDVSR